MEMEKIISGQNPLESLDRPNGANGPMILNAQGENLTASLENPYGGMVSEIIDKLEINHLLDFGCGDLSLARSLNPEREFKNQAYDPYINPYTDTPVPAELVAVINVLEYSENIEKTLDELEELVESILFCVVAYGRIKQPLEWWLPKIWERFHLQTFQVLDEHEFMVIAGSIDSHRI